MKMFAEFLTILRTYYLGHRTYTYLNFYSHWIRFHFCFCFFIWYAYMNNEFCNMIKNLIITARIERCKPIIRKKKKKNYKIVLLAKSELHSIEV